MELGAYVLKIFLRGNMYRVLLSSFPLCGRCNKPISEHEPFCPNRNLGTPSSMLNRATNKKHRERRFGTRTKYERLLALALWKKRIEFQANPLIKLSACIEYTPDFLIRRRLILEVDGGIHDLDFLKTPDRIRQRALEKLGYSVYRVRNEVVMSSPQKVTEEILQRYYEAFEAQLTQSPPLLTKPENMENIYESKPYNDQVLSAAIRMKDFTNRWNYTKFCKYISEIDRNFLTNPCYTERLILVLLGLDLTINDCGKLNFKNLFDNFMNGINIMSNLYGDRAKVYLVNGFNVSVANFMKNLIFYGGPRIKPGLVVINSIESLDDHILQFNNYFSSIGVRLERNEVKSECLHVLERLDAVSRQKYIWLSNWIAQNSKKTDFMK